jgi:hypothetical protein
MCKTLFIDTKALSPKNSFTPEVIELEISDPSLILTAFTLSFFEKPTSSSDNVVFVFLVPVYHAVTTITSYYINQQNLLQMLTSQDP